MTLILPISKYFNAIISLTSVGKFNPMGSYMIINLYSHIDRLFKDIEISLCGPPKKDEEFSPTLFDLHKVPFDEFVMLFQMSKNPFDDQNLVVRIKDQYYMKLFNESLVFLDSPTQ